MRDPEYSGPTTGERDALQEEDFDTDDCSEIDGHSVLAASRFPPGQFTDLKLSVVEPGGDLNRNGLERAYGGAHGVEAVDGVDDDTVREDEDLLEERSRTEFDEDIGE